MLVRFKFNNFKCFRDEAVLSMVASKYKSDDKVENTFKTDYYSLLKSAAVYGANASGKTKLFQAFDFMRDVVLSSDKQSDGWQEKYAPFKLSTVSTKEPSIFEVVFILEGLQYRYGFELNGNEIITEWLFRKKQREIELLYRDAEGISYSSEAFNDKVASNLIEAKMVRKETLFLTALSAWNDSLASKIRGWFSNCRVLSASTSPFMGYSISKMDTPLKDNMLKLMQASDIDIDDMQLNEVPVETLSDEIKHLLPSKALGGRVYNGVHTVHKIYDELKLSCGTTKFSLENDESYGTNRLFALSAPILDALNNGSVLWIDEIDNGLHAELLESLVRLFHNEKTNPKNAQFIINTHSISLIDDSGLYRRDQIYITEKNRYGESVLIPVSDFSGLRPNSKLGTLYKEGRFGGIPYLNGFNKLEF